MTISATALNAYQVQQLIQQTYMSNISNAKTPGFQAHEVVTGDSPFYTYLTHPDMTAGDVTKPTGVYYGHGSSTAGTIRDLKRGEPQKTDKALDMFLDGRGYMAVNFNGATGYVRSGRLQVNKDKRLATIDGYELEAEIIIPEGINASDPKQLIIEADGSVFAVINSNKQPLGTIPLYDFNNEQGLVEKTGGVFLETQSSGEPIAIDVGLNEDTKIVQGYYEDSNVDMITQLMSFMESSHVLTAINQLLKTHNDSQRDTMKSVSASA